MLWNEYVIRNRNLDANEKEMLSVLLSFEDGSESVCKKTVYYYCSAQNEKTNDKIFSALKKKGHLKLIKNIDALNHKIWWDYEVYQKPLEIPVDKFETRHTTAPDKMLLKASPGVIAQLSEKYGLDPSVVENLHADLVATGAPMVNEAAPVLTPSVQGFFEQLASDGGELQRIATKYELSQEDIIKHLENFKANKKSFFHKEKEKYNEHFDNYVGKCIPHVKQVMKARKDQTKKAATPSVKTAYKPESNEDILKHTRSLYADIKEIKQELPFSEYKEQVDLFVQYAKKCENLKIGNEALTDIYNFYKNLRAVPGALRKYYDSQLALDPSVNSMINKISEDLKNKDEPPEPPS